MILKSKGCIIYTIDDIRYIQSNHTKCMCTKYIIYFTHKHEKGNRIRYIKKQSMTDWHGFFMLSIVTKFII